MGDHVFELPEESGDLTQFVNTMIKLQEIAQTTYVDSYEETAMMFADPMTKPIATRPPPLDQKGTTDDKIIREEELKLYAKTAKTLKKTLTTLRTIIWGQVSPAMKTKFKANIEYENEAPHMIACGLCNR